MEMLGNKIARARKELGLTQEELARSAGVCLATVQNLEGGRANPALRTLGSIAAVLGLESALQAGRPDWDELAALGVPVTAAGGPRHLAPKPEMLVAGLRLAVRAVTESPGQARTSEALGAALLALRLHFPAFYRTHFGRSPLVGKLLPSAVNGRLVKLARLARASFAEYL
jgi:transcriptional regulator with XRE-family HTH domain